MNGNITFSSTVFLHFQFHLHSQCFFPFPFSFSISFLFFLFFVYFFQNHSATSALACHYLLKQLVTKIQRGAATDP